MVIPSSFGPLTSAGADRQASRPRPGCRNQTYFQDDFHESDGSFITSVRLWGERGMEEWCVATSFTRACALSPKTVNRRENTGGIMSLPRGELPLGNLPGTRYPDPRIEVLDARFRYKQGNAAIERIATGFRWAEGPVYFRDGGYLIFS